jgi:Tat protein translocase TatB subunit
MFDIGIGFSELLLIGVIALIVVGPEDLPVLLRTLGRYARSVKHVADEFRAEFDKALKDAEIDQLKSPIDEMQKEIMGSQRTMSAALDGENLIDFEEHNRRILENEKLDLAARREGEAVHNAGAGGVAEAAVPDAAAAADDMPMARKEGH